MLSARDAEAYKRHADELVRFATTLVGPSDARDIVATGVLSAMTSPRWRSVQDPRAYLYRSVLNAARQARRSGQRRRRREERAARPDVVESAERDLDVLRAVSRLSLRQRAVVYLAYWEDLAPQDVAEVLGISEGAARRHLARARARLREMIA